MGPGVAVGDEEAPGRGAADLARRGATTPLVVPGWTLADLEVVMRATAGNGAAAAPTARALEPVADAFTPATLAAVADDPAIPTVPGQGAESSLGARRWRFQRRSATTWKSVVTVVLLAFLAAAVTLVLLQSAGIISWGFLGPTA